MHFRRRNWREKEEEREEVEMGAKNGEKARAKWIVNQEKNVLVSMPVYRVQLQERKRTVEQRDVSFERDSWIIKTN